METKSYFNLNYDNETMSEQANFATHVAVKTCSKIKVLWRLKETPNEDFVSSFKHYSLNKKAKSNKKEVRKIYYFLRK